MSSNLAVPLSGGGSFQVAAPGEDRVLPELLLDAQHGLLQLPFTIEPCLFLHRLLFLFGNVVEQTELCRGFRFGLYRILSHEPIGCYRQASDGQLRIDLAVINVEHRIGDAADRGCLSRQGGCSMGMFWDISAIGVRHGLGLVECPECYGS